MKGKRRDIGQIRDLMKRIKDKKAQGSTIEDACKDERLSVGTYYKYQNDLAKIKPVKKPYAETIQAAPQAQSKLVCLVGSPAEIATFLQDYKQ